MFFMRPQGLKKWAYGNVQNSIASIFNTHKTWKVQKKTAWQKCRLHIHVHSGSTKRPDDNARQTWVRLKMTTRRLEAGLSLLLTLKFQLSHKLTVIVTVTVTMMQWNISGWLKQLTSTNRSTSHSSRVSAQANTVTTLNCANGFLPNYMACWLAARLMFAESRWPWAVTGFDSEHSAWVVTSRSRHWKLLLEFKAE
jgi:hypothetical protein